MSNECSSKSEIQTLQNCQCCSCHSLIKDHNVISAQRVGFFNISGFGSRLELRLQINDNFWQARWPNHQSDEQTKQPWKVFENRDNISFSLHYFYFQRKNYIWKQLKMLSHLKMRQRLLQRFLIGISGFFQTSEDILLKCHC